MKASSLCAILMLHQLIAFSQDSDNNIKYAAELAKHQQNYKAELVPIIKNDTSFVSFYRVTSAYRLDAAFEHLRNQPVFNMGTSSGMTKQAQKIGLVKFSIGNQKYQLSAYQLLALRSNPDLQDLFFIPFTDATSGDETYSAGRYLDFKLSEIRNGSSLTVDFNKAYNPYCAFVDGYNCPIPPSENQLEVEIKAGEKAYGKKWK